MHRRIELAAAAAILVAVSVWSVACEDSTVVAPKEGQILLTATPEQAVVDDDGQAARSTITAQVVDANGFLLQGIGVFLAASGGAFETSTPDQALETDGNGIAIDTLVLLREDPATVSVLARSSTLTATVDVTNPLGGGNQRPTASINPDPDDTLEDTGIAVQEVGLPVIFDGRGSTDAENDELMCFRWTITSSSPAGNLTAQGDNLAVLERTYGTEQSLSVKLEVSDQRFVDCPRSVPVGAAPLNGVPDVIPYLICNDITDPIPVIDIASTVWVLDQQTGRVQVPVSGTSTFDQEGTPASSMIFRWRCSDQAPTQTGPTVTCEYTSVGVRSITLTVDDPGTISACTTSADTFVSITVTQGQ